MLVSCLGDLFIVDEFVGNRYKSTILTECGEFIG